MRFPTNFLRLKDIFRSAFDGDKALLKFWLWVGTGLIGFQISLLGSQTILTQVDLGPKIKLAERVNQESQPEKNIKLIEQYQRSFSIEGDPMGAVRLRFDKDYVVFLKEGDLEVDRILLTENPEQLTAMLSNSAQKQQIVIKEFQILVLDGDLAEIARSTGQFANQRFFKDGSLKAVLNRTTLTREAQGDQWEVSLFSHPEIDAHLMEALAGYLTLREPEPDPLKKSLLTRDSQTRWRDVGIFAIGAAIGLGSRVGWNYWTNQNAVDREESDPGLETPFLWRQATDSTVFELDEQKDTLILSTRAQMVAYLNNPYPIHKLEFRAPQVLGIFSQFLTLLSVPGIQHLQLRELSVSDQDESRKSFFLLGLLEAQQNLETLNINFYDLFVSKGPLAAPPVPLLPPVIDEYYPQILGLLMAMPTLRTLYLSVTFPQSGLLSSKMEIFSSIVVTRVVAQLRSQNNRRVFLILPDGTRYRPNV